MEKLNLINILHGDISLISKVDERDVALYGMRIFVRPKILGRC